MGPTEGYRKAGHSLLWVTALEEAWTQVSTPSSQEWGALVELGLLEPWQASKLQQRVDGLLHALELLGNRFRAAPGSCPALRAWNIDGDRLVIR